VYEYFACVSAPCAPRVHRSQKRVRSLELRTVVKRVARNWTWVLYKSSKCLRSLLSLPENTSQSITLFLELYHYLFVCLSIYLLRRVSLCRPGCPGTHRDPCTSTFCVLELKMSATTSGTHSCIFKNKFALHVLVCMLTYMWVASTFTRWDILLAPSLNFFVVYNNYNAFAEVIGIGNLTVHFPWGSGGHVWILWKR
jgi:hypothetical protein